MSRLKRIRTRINKENLEKAQKEGHITEEQAQEVIDTNGLYNPYTDTYINPDILQEISVTAKAPERTWTSEWSYNDPEFRLAREHRNIAAQEVAKSTRDKMHQVGNAIGKTIIGGTSFTPLWFAAPIAKAGIAASEGDYSGAAKEAAIGLLAPYAIGKGLEKGYSAYQAYRGWQNGLKEAVAKGFQNVMTPVRTNKYGTVKYYGPTMGKTTAVRTNPRLVDFDDIVREEIQQLANKKGISVRELKTKSDIEYAQLLENAVSKWQANPANKDKTLLISNSVLSNKPIFDNTPVIPSKNQFIARQVTRGESNPTFAAQYYDDLLKRNPQLKIDDRFVSEIESGTRSAKISESELLGIPKGERKVYLRGTNADPSFYSGIGLNNQIYSQKIRDYHAAQSGNNLEVVSHMSPNNFTVFDKNFFGTTTDEGFNGIGFYFGKTRKNPYNYKPNQIIPGTERKTPRRVGPHGEIWIHSYPGTPRYFYLYGKEIKGAPKEGTNLFDNPEFIIHRTTPITISEFILGHPEQIKLADAITYSDNGEIIPMSLRDNLKNPDIRYQQGGKLNYLNYIK